ncbi:RNA polymerase sigma-70 factor (ECF subfamily) [Catenuloplanes nepalensis]|uniref:RNA polymerase sigma factor n=1 Tax=Catenuloplanes nepalensis TaxID=587533 RepID=A0ABT9N2C8_9ACTN|nr:RNA polymerase sigma factor [Catenuloplanes nepalensis]MDP9797857.1 RNA polymerase sigma-70 factor (ECF subfamily) [Catenuloplanes nepalensis]
MLAQRDEEIGDDDERALTEIYHACYRRLVTQVYAFTTDLTEAQDVVQEAFARALARPGTLTSLDNPEAWLRTVAINVVRRRWRRRKLLDTILLRDRPLVEAVAPPPSPERPDVHAALARIPAGYRQVITLHYFADLPVEEIAQLLDLPTGTVKSRLYRGRAAMSELLADYPGHAPEQAPQAPEKTMPTPAPVRRRATPLPGVAAAGVEVVRAR